MKPDQLIKRRGKLGLIKVNADLAEVQKWVGERIGRDVQVSVRVDEVLCHTAVAAVDTLTLSLLDVL